VGRYRVRKLQTQNENRDVGVMHKQFADEAIVVIKQKASENMVTCLRIKLSDSTKDSKDEGWNMLT
jgi:ferredoxin-fold anticodon binding domain-containing protein